MTGGVQSWDHANWGPPSFESVRSLHRPDQRFRISSARYEPGTSFQLASRAGRRYVLAGSCSYADGASAWELRAGEYADLPEGRFEFRVLGASPVELVSVWELAPGYWGSGIAEPGAAPDRWGSDVF